MSRAATVPTAPDDEAALLGAALLTREAAELVARQTQPSDFYLPLHQRLRDAIVELVAAGQPVDVVTVTSAMARLNGTATVTTKAQLLAIQADCPSAANAPAYLRAIRGCERRRRMLTIAGQLTNAATIDGSVDGVVAQLEGLHFEQQMGRSTWDQADVVTVTAALAGDIVELEPTVLVRSDGTCLLYAGKVHTFAGEPESGKTWLLLHACAEQISAGRHAFYLDFEDDLTSVVARLVALGVDPERILTQFHYTRPTEPLSRADWAIYAGMLTTYQPTVVVIDGLTEALTLHDLEVNSNRDNAAFFALLPRPIAHMGPAVGIIDHVAKDNDQRGRWSIGAQHKLAGVDGAAYGLEVIRPIVRGRDGLVKVTVNKDRPGHVRRASAGKVVAELRTRSVGALLELELVIGDTTADDSPFRPTVLMESVSRWLELNPDSSRQAIKDSVRGKTQYVVTALDVLVAEGHIAATPGARGALLCRVVKPYRGDDDQ
jgi:hypothetical protein